jgi:hypothetical protein
LHLTAAGAAVEAPRDEVLAVVGQQVVLVFAEAAACAAHRFHADELRGRVLTDRDFVAGGELFDGDFLHRAAMQRLREAGIVDDHAVARVDAVVFVARAARDEFGAERRFVVERETASGLLVDQSGLLVG